MQLGQNYYDILMILKVEDLHQLALAFQLKVNGKKQMNPLRNVSTMFTKCSRKLKEKATKIKDRPGKQQLDKYLASIHTLSDDVDPLSFWVEEENK